MWARVLALGAELRPVPSYRSQSDSVRYFSLKNAVMEEPSAAVIVAE